MRRTGAALIELLCALTIFIITTTIYIELTNRKMIALEKAQLYTRAVLAADTWATRCRAMTSAQLDQQHNSTFKINGLTTRDDSPVGRIRITRTGQIRLVTVIVRWQGPKSPKLQSVSMQTQVVR